MKTKFILTISVLLAAGVCASGATNEMSTLLERGLFEEEANHQLEAAISAYQGAIAQFDHERRLAATAIFRLGECYRKQGKTNEASAQYERIVREFPDQPQLAQLSRAYLPTGVASRATVTDLPILPSDEEEFMRKVREVVQSSPDLVNQQLSQAVEHGYVSAAEFLLAHGADVNWATPIAVAALHGNEAMVQMLLSHGADVNGNESDSSRHTALHIAVVYGFLTVCHTLVAHGADVNARDIHGMTPLQDAVEGRRFSIAGFLITNKAQIDVKNNDGQTPLYGAISHHEIQMARLLLDNHADANLEIPEGNGPPPLLKRTFRTPLSFAMTQPEFVKLLLEAHANPNAVTTTASSGQTPLMQASTIETHAAEVVQLLLDHGANVNAVDDNGGTALVYAIMGEKIEVIPKLIEHGADVNILDKKGAPPLSYVRLTETGRQIKELLIKAGADPDYNRRRGIWTADANGMPQSEIIQCPSNSINHYTLLEYIATLYQAVPEHGMPDGVVPNARYARSAALTRFPNFSQVGIHRMNGKGTSLGPVDVRDILTSGDCSKDVALQAGDTVNIPVLEHPLASKWPGLSEADVMALTKCLLRSVRVLMDGKTYKIVLAPAFALPWVLNGYEDSRAQMKVSVPGDLEKARIALKADLVVRSFLLDVVVHDPNILLNTSDLSKVRLTRGVSKWTFDLTIKTPPDVWLENGDVIEIPGLGEAAPATEAK